MVEVSRGIGPFAVQDDVESDVSGRLKDEIVALLGDRDGNSIVIVELGSSGGVEWLRDVAKMVAGQLGDQAL